MWQGWRDKEGYGGFSIGAKSAGNARAHRWAYEHYRGPIPDGLTLDHLCKTPSCVNPDHLEAVTSRENLFRANSFQARNLAKTHCPQGHPYDEGNTYVDNDGARQCRACNRLRSAAYYRANRQKVLEAKRQRR